MPKYGLYAGAVKLINVFNEDLTDSTVALLIEDRTDVLPANWFEALRIDSEGLNCLRLPFIPRHVADGGMNATDGALGEIVFNTVDNKHYGCSTAGSPGTWSAMYP